MPIRKEFGPGPEEFYEAQIKRGEIPEAKPNDAIHTGDEENSEFQALPPIGNVSLLEKAVDNKMAKQHKIGPMMSAWEAKRLEGEDMQAMLIRFRFEKGMSSENMGKLFGVSRVTVWKWLHRYKMIEPRAGSKKSQVATEVLNRAVTSAYPNLSETSYFRILTGRQKEIWTLRNEQGLSVNDVAERLGISPRAVRKTENKIRKDIKPYISWRLRNPKE